MKRNFDHYGNLNTFYLMRLVARSYFTNYSSLFMDYALPIIITSILFNVLNDAVVKTMIPGVLISPIASTCFISFAIGYNEWKQSVIVKKIRVSQISTLQFYFAFVLFYFFVSWLAFLFLVGYSVFLEQVGLKSVKGLTDHITKINWGWVVLAIGQFILLTLTMGFLIATIAKKSSEVIALGLLIFLTESFLLGYYLPLSFILEKETMRNVAYFLPFYAPSRLFQIIWFEEVVVTETIYDRTFKFDLIKDWKIINLNETVWDGNVFKGFKYSVANFHNSYWSLILLGFGWTAVSASISLFLTKRLKFS